MKSMKLTRAHSILLPFWARGNSMSFWYLEILIFMVISSCLMIVSYYEYMNKMNHRKLTGKLQIQAEQRKLWQEWDLNK